MKTLKYKPKKSVNLGRFGNVDHKDIIEVTEQEWASISEDPRFEVIDQGVEKEVLEAAEIAQPYGTHDYDLRTIPWSHPNLFKRLESRTSKQRLQRIILSMREVGAPVRDTSSFEQRMFIVDAIVESALLCGWTKLSEKEVYDLPTFYEAGVELEELSEEKEEVVEEETVEEVTEEVTEEATKDEEVAEQVEDVKVEDDKESDKKEAKKVDDAGTKQTPKTRKRRTRKKK